MRSFLVCCCLCLFVTKSSLADEPAVQLDHDNIPASIARPVDARTANQVEQTTSEQPDPTVPSPEILQRLEQKDPSPVVTESIAVMPQVTIAPLPEILVKAIVLSDADHGVAMLECSGRKLIVPLSRHAAATREPDGSSPADQTLKGFAADGFTFHVADFSDRTLLLKTGNRTLLVQ